MASRETIQRSTQRRRERREEARRLRPDTLCNHCGQSFRPVRTDAVYCSPACRQSAYRERGCNLSKEAVNKFKLLVMTIPTDMYFDSDGTVSVFGVQCANLAENLKEFQKMPVANDVNVDIEFVYFGTDKFKEFEKIYRPDTLPVVICVKADSMEKLYTFYGEWSAEEISCRLSGL